MFSLRIRECNYISHRKYKTICQYLFTRTIINKSHVINLLYLSNFKDDRLQFFIIILRRTFEVFICVKRKGNFFSAAIFAWRIEFETNIVFYRSLVYFNEDWETAVIFAKICAATKNV